MINREPFPVKKICIWSLVAIFGLAISFIIFIAIISINIGLNNFNQDGFVIPILAGIFSIGISLFLFIWFIKFIIRLLKEKDIIRYS